MPVTIAVRVRVFGRRPVLRSAAGVLVGLPWCRSLPGARAAAVPGILPTGEPGKLVAIMTPNGVLRSKWMPEGEGAVFTLKDSFAPLSHLRERMLLFRGIDNPIPPGAAADNHRQSLGLWTGGPRKADLHALGPSFDSWLGNRLGAGAPMEVLRLGVQTPGSIGVGACSYDLNGIAKVGSNSSRGVFQSLFGQGPGGPAADPLRASILDDVLADYQRVARRVDALDRARLEAHLEAVRQVERGLRAAAPSCATPGSPADWPAHGGGFNDYSNPELTQTLMRTQFELAALALSCGRTRVVSIMLLQEGEGGSTSNYPWLDASLANHHAASHAQKDVLALADRYNLERTAQLASRLDELGLADSTLVVQGSGLSNGARHDSVDLPVFLLGRLGGRLRTGRLIQGNGRRYNDVILTILHAFGFPETTFGEAARCRGPFTDALA